ncbi:protocadherin gamma-A4-like [Anopheles marshallii]|uniref:protocadherin gamma-A4-like n=1 Tax=Anopheles marshallii TaxID=1521116 RepID=UPI00237C1961|nr:protocadherin gamma-A4-like [Anopheles marshallii]
MYLLLSVLAICLRLYASQECSSPTFDFKSYLNPELLDLTTLPGSVIARFPVEHVQSATIQTQDNYIETRINGTELQFFTTEAFAQYEEREIQQIVIIQVFYQCTSGSVTGLYRQYFKLANNHAPRFLQETYEAVVPLPLPKHFDLSPFLGNGVGIMARDIDLINNTVTFSISANDYMLIESSAVKDDLKQFKAILRLKEQVLKMPNVLELTVTAVDAGIPQKSSEVRVIIEPDLSIVYEDPPEFKETFINRTIELDLLLQLELIPGTETHDVQYGVEGADAKFFTLTVWANNTGVDIKVNNLHTLPEAKTFLNVVVVAKRSQLQKTSCVILLSIPPESIPEPPKTTVQKVLSVLHLKEMSEHRDIFPLVIDSCTYSIQSQTPGDYFFIQDTSLSSREFNREDADLFAGLDFPQFWIVLRLACPIRSTMGAESYNTSNRFGPMRDIEFSTDLTHLNIVVDDINDNSPVFTFPSNNARVAFPSPQLSRKLLPDQLLTVRASDLDEGINAVIRYSLAMNDHFDIDPQTGVIFPLKSAFALGESVTIEIFATDRDGAEDGNTSTMKLHVHKAADDQLAALTVKDMDPDTFQRTLQEISVKTGIQIETIRSVYSVDAATSNLYSRSASDARYTTTAVVYAFQDGQLVSQDELKGVFDSLETTLTVTVSKISELYGGSVTIIDSDTTVIYPYIIATAFCGTLAVAMAAAAFYYRAKTRHPILPNDSSVSPSRSSDVSDAIIVENDHKISSSTPPIEDLKISGVILTESVDNPPLLSDLLTIAEDTEHENNKAEPTPPTQQERKKSIKFNENVERIEVFDGR